MADRLQKDEFDRTLFHFLVRFCCSQNIFRFQAVHSDWQIETDVHITNLVKLFIGEITSLVGNIGSSNGSKCNALAMEQFEVFELFNGMTDRMAKI